MIRLNLAATIPILAIQLVLPAASHAQSTPYDIDVKELERPAPAPSPKTAKKKAPKRKKEAAPKAVTHENAEKPGFVTYTVRPGDYLFKILITKLGMSNDQAESLMPEVMRINKISNARDLEVGSKLLIPRPAQVRTSKHATKPAAEVTRKKSEAEAAAMLEAASRLDREGRAAGGPVAPSVPAAPPAPQAPAVHAPTAALPVAVAPQAAAPSVVTWVCPVIDRDPGRIVESILSALSISWCRNRIIQSDHSASIAFSIRVDRYFEHKGGRYIVSVGEADPYTYTLLRLVEDAGYHVLRLGSRDDLKTVGEKLLAMIGVVPDYGRHALQGGKEIKGFLVQQEDAGGRRVVISKETVEQDQKWVMAPGCGAR